MAGIRDARGDSVGIVFLRVFGCVIASLIALVILREVGSELGDPRSAFARYRDPVAPHVHVTGKILRGQGRTSFPPLCRVEHESWVSCGKSRCWKVVEHFNAANARVVPTEGGGPSLDLGPDFAFEPWTPERSVVASPDDERAWLDYARERKFGFTGQFSPQSDRVVTTCAQDGDRIFVEACVLPNEPNHLGACPGQPHYGVVWNGDAQAALDNAADEVAAHVGAAAAALLVAALVWLRVRRPIMVALEERATPQRKSLGVAWALLAAPPLLGFSVLLMHASLPPSTWASGRGGFAFALSVFAAWLFFLATRRLHRERTLLALAPVLRTERSPLANANGTVELAVRARGNELRSFIGDEPVAYSEIVIKETYRAGKNTSSREVHRSRQTDRLRVSDESGEGVLDLSSSVLDVEQRAVTMPALSPRYFDRGIVVDTHLKHIDFTVREWVIKDGEPLYVFGDVSDIVLSASESGYRTVRGAPTLGGKDAAPVLVHSGDERGLITLLSREARAASSFAVVAACMCTAIAASLIALARF